MYRGAAAEPGTTQDRETPRGRSAATSGTPASRPGAGTSRPVPRVARDVIGPGDGPCRDWPFPSSRHQGRVKTSDRSMSCGTLTPTGKTHDELQRHWYVPAHPALPSVFGSGPRSGAHHCQPPRAGLEPALQWRRDRRRHRGATTWRHVHCAAPPYRPRRLRPSGKRGPPGTPGRPQWPYPSSAASHRITRGAPARWFRPAAGRSTQAIASRLVVISAQAHAIVVREKGSFNPERAVVRRSRPPGRLAIALSTLAPWCRHRLQDSTGHVHFRVATAARLLSYRPRMTCLPVSARAG
jgi:hypothetical protein